MTEPNGRYVSYTTKEMFTEIKSSIDRVEAKLDHKADKAELVELQNRFSGLEKHGSIQAVEALKELAEVKQDVRQIQIELRDRPAQVKAHEQIIFDVESLKVWRNRIVGGLSLVSAVAGVNVAHLWFGF